jgi:hypothetical protein
LQGAARNNPESCVFPDCFVAAPPPAYSPNRKIPAPDIRLDTVSGEFTLRRTPFLAFSDNILARSEEFLALSEDILARSEKFLAFVKISSLGARNSLLFVTTSSLGARNSSLFVTTTALFVTKCQSRETEVVLRAESIILFFDIINKICKINRSVNYENSVNSVKKGILSEKGNFVRKTVYSSVLFW